MSVERYNDLFIADFMAGTLHWRVSPARHVRAGDRAGHLHSNGYRYVKIDGKDLREHRLIVSMIEGRMLGADEEVDHENGVRDDNRIENLRVVTHSENQRNRRGHRDGKPVGVTWDKRNRKWRAQVWLDCRVRNILYHPDQSVAARAFEIVDKLLKNGVSFDEAKDAARLECPA